jgi:hypothetical protein
MDHDERQRAAEAALERELDESRGRPRVVPARGHRIGYSLPLVVVVAAIASVAAYALGSLTLKFGWPATVAYALPGLAIATLAWGTTGLSRVRATASDRMFDIAICVLVGSIVLGVAQPPPLSTLFVGIVDDGKVATGLGGMPRFHVIATWSTTVACGALAAASLLRIALEHHRR